MDDVASIGKREEELRTSMLLTMSKLSRTCWMMISFSPGQMERFSRGTRTAARFQVADARVRGATNPDE
jgi:hypothetical protein